MKGIAAILVFATASVAAPLQAADDVSLNANDIKWGPAPPVLPKGARSRCSTATRSSRVPTRYASGHTQAEDLTIISGALYLGMGDKMDTKGAHALKTGGFHHLPGKMHHYAFSKSPTVIQISGEGPFDITYLNPRDDPSGSQK